MVVSMKNKFEESEFIIIRIKNNIVVNVILKDETIWITKKVMSKLFECSTDNIGLYLKIFI